MLRCAIVPPYNHTVPLADSTSNPIGRLTKKGTGIKIMDLNTKKLSSLVPKIKIYKIKHQQGTKQTKVPIKFPTGFGADPGSQWQPGVDDLFEGPTKTHPPDEFFYTTRAGYGIKSFSWAYEGQDTYSANRDITASLVLYFQDFAQLTVERTAKGGEKYRYLDLILATEKNKDIVAGLSAKSSTSGGPPNAYQQDILIEAGWAVPQTSEFTKEDKAIIESNSDSLVLTMEDYSFAFDQGGNGSFSLQIDYRARAEQIARDKLINVVAPLDGTVQNIIDAKDAMDEAKKAQKGDTESDDYNDKKEVHDTLIVKSKDEAYKRITNILQTKKSIYYTDVTLADIISGEGGGLAPGHAKEGDTTDFLEKCVEAGSTEPLLANAKEKDDGKHRFFYTFFGDIVDAAMEVAADDKVIEAFYPADDITNVQDITKKYRIALCQFKVGSAKYNLADLPVSIDLFASFFFDKIINEDTQTKSIGMFVKNLLSYVVNGNIENYFNEKNGDSRSFRTAYITLGNDLQGKQCDPPGRYNPDDAKPGTDFSYMVVYAISSASELIITKYTDAKSRDLKNNLAHFILGNEDSIVKNISFEKLSWEYAREHRLVDNAGSPFNILANVFNVKVTLFGNTLFQPGSMIFVYPRSMGDIGKPWTKGSISNIMGLGGYHFVTKVQNSIDGGAFQTSLEAIWQTSGDGSAFIK